LFATVTIVQLIVMQQWGNSWTRALSSNAVWRRVTTATMWRVPAVRSRQEQLKPGTRGRQRCRDVLVRWWIVWHIKRFASLWFFLMSAFASTNVLANKD